jgi:hypothetical protein
VGDVEPAPDCAEVDADSAMFGLPRISVCNNRRSRFQTMAAARTGWKTGKLLQETGRTRALPSEPPKTGARTKKPQILAGGCGFRRRVSNGLPNPIAF